MTPGLGLSAGLGARNHPVGGAAWSPSDLGAELGVWYDASSGSNTVSAGRMDILADLSGNGGHLTYKVTTDRRPTTTTVNSLQAISFNGTDQGLENVSTGDHSTNAPISSLDGWRSMRVFTVASFDRTDTPSSDFIYYVANNVNNPALQLSTILRTNTGADPDPIQGWQGKTNLTQQTLLSGASADIDLHLFESYIFHINASNNPVSFVIDGVEEGTGNVNGTDASAHTKLWLANPGNTQYANCTICEMVVQVSGSNSVTNYTTEMRSYLNAKWGL